MAKKPAGRCLHIMPPSILSSNLPKDFSVSKTLPSKEIPVYEHYFLGMLNEASNPICKYSKVHLSLRKFDFLSITIGCPSYSTILPVVRNVLTVDDILQNCSLSCTQKPAATASRYCVASFWMVTSPALFIVSIF